MLSLTTITSTVLGANCYLVAHDDGTCVVIDPSGGVVGAVREHVERHGLHVAAVLATHGHVDHVLDAAAAVAAFDVPLTVAEADAYRIADPFGTLEPAGSGLVPAIAAAAGIDVDDHRVPERVETFSGVATEMRFGGIDVTCLAAPGHTEGSTLYRVDGVEIDGQERRLVLTGDVLFAGTVGRVDLPGGDAATMQHTLTTVVGALDGDLVVLPGHGPATTIARERTTNPYLTGAARL
ncbi:Glyoxylase, beta-lactamase superfamily II [Paraoerskovia marina]|uniref:Glyoxylase, beta-lactamase superfamily II n=1 Tax=Paraoerskovia marina TaxID=545619 RepID=A0A1H1SN35_9CELL|nr:MBL fold metallo-hydrolase [Paraoerskovia marina]SDS48799.1 Glyoxylase, beta-lactamase superfamily II [Paraoerskovia marina]